MPFSPIPGLELAGRYRLVGRIGGGALGSVWKAIALDGTGEYAIKVLRGEGVGEAAVEHVRVQRNEVARIGHPGVVVIDEVLGVGEPDEILPAAVMPLLRGKDLDRWLRDEPRRLVEVLPVLREAVSVLEAAHAARDPSGLAAPIAHLGLKPTEIFVGLEEYADPLRGTPMRVHILDFGLVRDRTEEDATGTMTVVGSPRYTSPEVFVAPELTGPRSDIWSLGVILFLVASGRYPFGEPNDTAFVLQRRIVDGPSPSLAEVAPRLPAELCAIVDRCLAKDPAARFADAAELGQALDALPELPGSLIAHSIPIPSAARARAGEGLVAGSSIAPPAPPTALDAPTVTERRARRSARVLSLSFVVALGAFGVAYFLIPARPVPTMPVATREPIDAGTADAGVDAGASALTEPMRTAADELLEALLQDNPFRAFRVPVEPRLLGCSEEPPSVPMTVTTFVDPQPIALSTIDGGLLNGLVRHTVCSPGERRDPGGRCWTLGCPSGTEGPDETGHCVGRRQAVVPLQTCFRDGALVRSVSQTEGLALQEHEVSFAELGRFLRETGRRAWLAIDPATLEARPTVWDGTVSPEVATLPAHGVPRLLASHYCAAIDARLPTEAELETAARGRGFKAAPWGSVVVAYGVHLAALAPSAMPPRPVRDERSLDRTIADDPLYDLVSNVREWASDDYRPDGTMLAFDADAGVGIDANLDGGAVDAGLVVEVSPASPGGPSVGVVRGLPLVRPQGWPSRLSARELRTLLPVPAAYRSPVCASGLGPLESPGDCAQRAPGHAASLRDVGFRCARP